MALQPSSGTCWAQMSGNRRLTRTLEPGSQCGGRHDANRAACRRAAAAPAGRAAERGFTELPGGALAEQSLQALPGKVPLIRKTARPPNFETPIEYFRTPITRNDASFRGWPLPLLT